MQALLIDAREGQLASNRPEKWADLTGLVVEEPVVAQPPLDFGS